MENNRIGQAQVAQKLDGAADSEQSFKKLGDDLRTDPRDFKQQESLKLKPFLRKETNPGQASPLSIPREGVEMPWVGAGKPSSERGYLRGSNGFWTAYANRWPEQLSEANMKNIGKTLPVVDETWVEFHPEHKAYMGEPLEHHHVGQGALAVPLPEKLHDAYTVFHPKRQVVGEPGQPLRPIKPLPTSKRQEAEIKRHIRQDRIMMESSKEKIPRYPAFHSPPSSPAFPLMNSALSIR